jgi:CarD family transcriptional regulator
VVAVTARTTTVAGTAISAAIKPVTALIFEVGERVVHPQHGVGQIVRLEDREFERGLSRRYYEIDIPGGSTVWVPVEQSNSGLRKLASKNDLERCRVILKAHPQPVTDDGRVRQSELVEHLRQGTIAAQCEVVRDLSAFVSHKPAYGTIPTFLEAILRVLSQEWAIVEEIPVPDALFEISSLMGMNN